MSVRLSGCPSPTAEPFRWCVSGTLPTGLVKVLIYFSYRPNLNKKKYIVQKLMGLHQSKNSISPILWLVRSYGQTDIYIYIGNVCASVCKSNMT